MTPLRLRHTAEWASNSKRPQRGSSSPFLPLLRGVVRASTRHAGRVRLWFSVLTKTKQQGGERAALSKR